MKTYQCHKKVSAGQIKEVGEREASGINVILDDGNIHRLTVDMIIRHLPVVGDYLVRYEDGYTSVSPQKAFEDGYTAVYAPGAEA